MLQLIVSFVKRILQLFLILCKSQLTVNSRALNIIDSSKVKRDDHKSERMINKVDKGSFSTYTIALQIPTRVHAFDLAARRD